MSVEFNEYGLHHWGMVEYCIGCGKHDHYVAACYVVDNEPLPPRPEYPFDENNCPVCVLRAKVIELEEKIENQIDPLTKRLLLRDKK